MESFTKIETCSNCKAQYRIPTDKHIIATCPNCGLKSEYRNGEKVAKKKKRRWIPVFFTLLALGLIGFWLIGNNSKGKKAEDFTTVSTDTTSIFTSTPTYPLDTSSTRPNADYRDTTEKLLDKFKDEIKDHILDVLKEILEEILEHTKEEADNGNWERANEWFERTIDIMKNGGKNGKALLKLYEGKLAEVKTHILSKNPSPNILPGSEISDDAKNESSHATAYVTNNTEYDLTLYYTGPTSTIVTIGPGRKEAVSLRKGTYSIVAKVSAPLVQEYYGSQTYKGFSYDVSYYITTSRY